MSVLKSVFALIAAGAALAAVVLVVPAASVGPEPAAWAVMLVGCGAAGSLLRRRGGKVYRLVEALPDGARRTEEFGAPDDATALARAAAVAEGRIELWRGAVRVTPQLEG